jgi:hypothetical protein
VRPATSRNRDSGPACDTQALRHEERSPSTVVSRARQPGSNARQTPLVLPRPGTGTQADEPEPLSAGPRHARHCADGHQDLPGDGTKPTPPLSQGVIGFAGRHPSVHILPAEYLRWAMTYPAPA